MFTLWGFCAGYTYCIIGSTTIRGLSSCTLSCVLLKPCRIYRVYIVNIHIIYMYVCTQITVFDVFIFRTACVLLVTRWKKGEEVLICPKMASEFVSLTIHTHHLDRVLDMYTLPIPKLSNPPLAYLRGCGT